MDELDGVPSTASVLCGYFDVLGGEYEMQVGMSMTSSRSLLINSLRAFIYLAAYMFASSVTDTFFGYRSYISSFRSRLRAHS